MKILADENIEFEIVRMLRSEGLAVRYVAEFCPGISDRQVLDEANKHKELLLTNDKDFGELIFRLRQTHSGVMLLRLETMDPEEMAIIVVEAFRKYQGKLSASFSVIENDKIRIRSVYLS